MAGLIKKQILKHLSKFTKNLSAESINLSAFRGEGELTNLELDCEALQNLVNLPTWLQLDKATCNKVSVKIPWTKLKTVPIKIYLDSVEVEMITCEKPRAPNGPSPIQSSSSGGSSNYGYTVKVLEGISLYINSISINFQSAAFSANFQLSQLSVESTDPKWDVTDLRATHILDKTIGQVLSFKQVSWQTMRIIADAVKTNDKANLTPIRLITNQTRLRLTLRRQTSDCSLVASRLSFELDDLLWVLTDSQVRAALLCVKSLSDAIERSEQQRRNLVGHDEQIPQAPKAPVQATDAETISNQRLFAKYSILESSFHVDLERVDLHVCEDGTMFNNIDCERIVEGGAIQMTLHKVKLDHYPEHRADGSRTHFRDFGETMEARNRWAADIIKKFRHDFSSLKKAATEANNLSYAATNRKPAKLSESCFSVRVEDVELYQVSASTSKKSVTSKLITSDRKELLLPEDMPLFHMIQTEYVYPDGRDYPAPHNNLFMQVNAIRVNVEWKTLLWLNQLSLVTVDAVQKMLEDIGVLKTLQQQEEEELEQQLTDSSTEEEHTDIRIQLLMPKVFIPGPESNDIMRPVGLEVQVSMATITNCREGVDCSRGHLNLALENLNKTYAANSSSEFPNNDELDLDFVHKVFQQHADGADLPIKLAIDSGNAKMMNKSLKGLASKDVWSVSIEQLWMDFIMSDGKKQSVNDEQTGGFLKPRRKNPSQNNPKIPSPFIDSFPIILWLAEVPHVSFDVESNNLKPEEPQKRNDQTTNEEEICPVTNSPTSQCSRDKTKSPETCMSPTGSSEDSPRLLRNPKLMQYYATCQKQNSVDVVSQASSCVQSSSSTRSRHKSKATYILAHTESPVRLQLDHHQFMFIMRLLEDVEVVGKRAHSDTESISRSIAQSPLHSSKNSVKATSGEASAFRLFTPNADIFLILREIPEKKNEKDVELVNHSAEHNKIKNENLSETKDANTLPSTNFEDTATSNAIFSNGKTELPKNTTSQPKFPSPPLSESGSDTISIFGDNSSIAGDVNDNRNPLNSNPATPQYNHLINGKDSKSLSDSKFRSDSFSLRDMQMHSKPPESNQLVRNYSTGNLTMTRERREHGLIEQIAVERISINTASSDTSLERGTHASISSSSGYESITPEPTSNLSPNNQVQYKSNCSRRLDVDNTSVSSHSSMEDFVLIQAENKTSVSVSQSMNQVKFTSSQAGSQQDTNSISGSESSALSSTAIERETSMLDSQVTVTNGSASSINSTGLEMSRICHVGVNTETVEIKEELSSLLHIHAFSGITIAVDSHESRDSTVKIVAPKVKISEVGNIKNNKIPSIFTTYKCKSTPLLHKAISSPNASIRIESGPRAIRFGDSAVDSGYLQLKAQNIQQSLKSSTLTNIGAFFEDEVEPKVMPMRINAGNVSIDIVDDMPSIYETSVSGPPVALKVHRATVDRDVTGVFHINLNDTCNEETTILSPSSTAKQNTTVPPPSNLELLELQEKCKAMEVERESLADMLQCLQDQLTSSEDEKTKLKLEVSELQSICEMLQNQ